MGVLGSNLDSPLIATPKDRVRYRPTRQIRLRGLLFNNPYLEAIRERSITDDEKWRDWSDMFAQDSTKLGDTDMGYLRKVFTSFLMRPLEVCPTSGGQFIPGAIQWCRSRFQRQWRNA